MKKDNNVDLAGVLNRLGSGFVLVQSQNKTVAASVIAEKNGSGHWSVSGGDAPLIFQAPEHDLDAAAPFAAALVVFDGLLARLPA